jgi:hypothetical protein
MRRRMHAVAFAVGCMSYDEEDTPLLDGSA